MPDHQHAQRFLHLRTYRKSPRRIQIPSNRQKLRELHDQSSFLLQQPRLPLILLHRLQLLLEFHSLEDPRHAQDVGLQQILRAMIQSLSTHLFLYSIIILWKYALAHLQWGGNQVQSTQFRLYQEE